MVEPTDELGSRLVQTAPDGILVSRGNRLVFVNPAAARLFGASSPEALLGTSPATLFHPDDEPVIRASIERTIDEPLRGAGRRDRHPAGRNDDRRRDRAGVRGRSGRSRRTARGPGRHRATARRSGASRERRAPQARFCRSTGRRMGLESPDRRGRVLDALETDARVRRRRDRAARRRLGAAAAPRRSRPRRRTEREPGTGRADVRRRVPAAPQGRPLSSTCSRAGSRCASSRTDPWSRIVGMHLDITRPQARRSGAARERGTPSAGVRRRAGGRVGLEPGNRRGRVLDALEADARVRPKTKSSRTSARGSACCIPTTGSGPSS